jgi:hypothetical protein
VNEKTIWAEQALGLRPMPDGSGRSSGGFDGGTEPVRVEEQATAAAREWIALDEAGLLRPPAE